jgi:hypothetical protein
VSAMAIFTGALTAEDVYRLVKHGYARPSRIEARAARDNLPGLSDETIAVVERKRSYWTWMEFCYARKCEPRGLLPERLGETRDG